MNIFHLLFLAQKITIYLFSHQKPLDHHRFNMILAALKASTTKIPAALRSAKITIFIATFENLMLAKILFTFTHYKLAQSSNMEWPDANDDDGGGGGGRSFYMLAGKKYQQKYT